MREDKVDPIEVAKEENAEIAIIGERSIRDKINVVQSG